MRSKILIIILLSFIIVGCTKTADPKIESLANCLAEKGVKEYGAFWCPNCAKQEKMFGSSFEIIKEKVYNECDPRCDVEDIKDLPIACRGKLGQTELCLQKNINKYPTWEFSNGETLIGVQEFSTLAEMAGCKFNEI